MSITITKRGVDEAIGHATKLEDFKVLAKPAVQAALDVVAGAQKSGIKRGPTGKAAASIGTHIHTARWGVYGNAGPRGTGRFREGFLAALFLNTGTGLQGPLGHRINAKHVFSFSAYGSTIGAGSLFGARFGAKASPITKGRGRYKQQRFGALGKVFAHSTVGMRAQPWAKAAASSSESKARSVFAETLRKNVAEAVHG
jgi:hypothetical protein